MKKRQEVIKKKKKKKKERKLLGGQISTTIDNFSFYEFITKRRTQWRWFISLIMCKKINKGLIIFFT